MSEGLKPCPFCGEATDLGIEGTSHVTGFAVACHECGGGVATRERGDAIEGWNHRTPGPATAKLVELASGLMGYLAAHNMNTYAQAVAAFRAEHGP